jgi:hypothetical protein
VNSSPPKPEVILTNFFAEPTVLLVPITSRVEDIKGVIRIRKSKKDKQHNGQKKKDKRTNNDLQNII